MASVCVFSGSEFSPRELFRSRPPKCVRQQVEAEPGLVIHQLNCSMGTLADLDASRLRFEFQFADHELFHPRERSREEPVELAW